MSVYTYMCVGVYSEKSFTFLLRIEISFREYSIYSIRLIFGCYKKAFQNKLQSF